MFVALFELLLVFEVFLNVDVGVDVVASGLCVILVCVFGLFLCFYISFAHFL